MNKPPHPTQTRADPVDEPAPSEAGAPLPFGWTRPRPEHLPAPTIWPAALSLAVTLLAWGIVTSWIIIMVGSVLFVASMAGWIGEIRHERAKHS